MIRLLLLTLGVLVVAGVQAGLGGIWRPLGVKPDLVLVAMIVLGVAYGPRVALWAALVGGLALDVLSVLPIGMQVLALALVAPLTALRARGGDLPTLLLPMVLTPPASFLYNGIQMLELALLGRPVFWGDWLAQIMFPLLLIDTLLVPIFWAPFGLLRRSRVGFILQR